MNHSFEGPVALLGGTFDPIHYGHIKPALTLADTLGWQQIRLQPCFSPPHRKPPEASDQQRLQMVRLAAELDCRLVADDWELRQGQPTRTVHTLSHLQAEYPRQSLHFIMGMDSFLSLTSWLNWQQLLTLAHLVVLPRPGYELNNASATLQQLLVNAETDKPAELQSGSGRIYIAQTPAFNISATELRQQLKDNPDCPELLPLNIFQYIRQQGLYQ
ncbi:nicotinic acid mononucleotide adenylyltransferase [Aliidiomarina minuta]|uniref:Probable nicotinate-nucleotide adenylyltransferase n=1 Tax=Aliidiomarina minuta TaxID=880057 RepID=A0A432W5G5_9GAMM|nr:nicotinate-nucleotide adenylyltransferase [Aliidiomarina minuta]RUO25281.1 nicotinic acid mononucleotide adenylyltransferase [Aliidiomarina minuta]